MNKYNWDLSRIFKDEKSFKDTISEVNSLLDNVVKYKGITPKK